MITSLWAGSRRSLLRLGLGATAGLLTASAQSAIKGSVARITRVEAIVIRTPNDGKPQPSAVRMDPVGAMTGGIGLADRLDHHSPSRTPGYTHATLVRIDTDQGITGWGECHAPVAPRVHRQIVTDLLGPVLMGQNALNVEVLWDKMYSTQRLRGYQTGFYMESIAGCDLALWDILGKFTRQPLYRLLGGKYRDRIPSYASAGADPAAARKLVDEGYKTLKMGLSKGSGTNDLQRVAAVSEAVRGRAQVMVDSLGAFKLSEAVRIGHQLDALGNIGWWEDPLGPEDLSGYPRLSQEVETPICAGEELSNRFQFRDLLASRSVDIINPDVCRAGGISETRRIAILADAYGVLWSPHVSTGSGPYRAASIHLAAATPNSVVIEGGNSYASPLGNVLLKQPLDYLPGSVGVPEGPGLGIEFIESELAKVTVRD